jgi:hypothetical protein
MGLGVAVLGINDCENKSVSKIADCLDAGGLFVGRRRIGGRVHSDCRLF